MSTRAFAMSSSNSLIPATSRLLRDSDASTPMARGSPGTCGPITPHSASGAAYAGDKKRSPAPLRHLGLSRRFHHRWGLILQQARHGVGGLGPHAQPVRDPLVVH